MLAKCMIIVAQFQRWVSNHSFLSAFVLSHGYSSAASKQPGQSGQFASRHQALPDHQQ